MVFFRLVLPHVHESGAMYLFRAGLWAAVFAVQVRAADETSTLPLSIPPSLFFDGNDGQWSTFFVQVGTPAQSVRVLPGTSASAGTTLWVVLPEGCADANPGLVDCSDNRHTFTRNQSRTWTTDSLDNGGLYALNTFEERNLGLTGNAYYGFDTVQLGLGGSGMPTMDSQLVAGIATNDFWLGSLGLSPVPFNFTTLTDPVTSMLGNLRNGSLIPSSSWGYTAGAAYHDPPVYGSLTLGGYDGSRFDSSLTLTDIGFGADFSRDLVVELQSITYSSLGSSPLLAGSFNMFIDSMVSHMWLPVDACKAFEKAFNLTWNSTLELYLIDDAVRAALLAENPTFAFTIGAGGTRNDTVEIKLPYAAFDLQVSQPIVENGSSRYFPLKQAQNSTQYTLGRVFLQEAYIIADYDRQNFTVAQALFPSTSKDQDLHAILPPDSSVGKKASSIGAGPIAGIVVGAVAIIAVLILAFLWRHRSSKKKKRLAADELAAIQAASKSRGNHDLLAYQDMKDHPELDGEAQRHEIDGQKAYPPELEGVDCHLHEINGSEVLPPELDDQNNGLEIGVGGKQTSPHEIGGREFAYELEAPVASTRH